MHTEEEIESTEIEDTHSSQESCCCENKKHEHEHHEDHNHEHHEEECCCHTHHHHDHDEQDEDHEHCHCGHDHNHSHKMELGADIGCSCGHCHDDDDDHDHDHDEGGLKKIIISAVLLVLGLVCEHLIPFTNLLKNTFSQVQIEKYVQIGTGIIYMIAYLVIARKVVLNAIKNLTKGKIFDEQFLMTVASLGAVCVKEFPEAVAVMLFYQIGELFEDYAVDKSKKSINSLMEICPDKANVIRDGKEVSVGAEEVLLEEIVVVRPGERIPVDGIITKGKSFLDTSALTGESVPREVLEGSEVFSGSINTSSVIELKCTRPSSDSAASRIIKLVSESNEKKTKTERFITRFSKVYTPTVVILALLVAVLPPVYQGLIKHGNFEWSVWIYRALTFLVVSCPCALVISVPLTFFGGIGAASKKGILVKGSNSIEGLSRVKTAVFDKTGTLTKGVFEVSDIHCAKDYGISEEQLIAIAAHAETYSNHPAAVSLKNAHHGECCALAKVTDAQEIGGQGIKVNLDGKTVLAGNERLMINNSVQGYSKCPMNDAGTIIHIAIEGVYAGHIVISDKVKADTASGLKQLKKNGVSKIVMLTGDNLDSASKTASELGVTDYFAELLPGDKVSKVEELISCKKGKGTVLFAGDGINDAPVLARVDVGVAMGALGSDAAIESADVVIMNDSITQIADGIKISKKTKAIVYQNIILSLGVKVGIMVLSAFGLTGMWLAVFGDVGVCFIAILNAMRALGFSKKK